MNFTAMIRLLARNHFDFAMPYYPVVLANCFYSLCINGPLGALQKLLYGHRVRKTQVRKDPVFIIGHWRSGTTLLHELLSRDPQFTYPSYFQCFYPQHFLVSKSLFLRFFGESLSRSRPFDNMALGWNKPREDEFALCNLGLPSPYLMVAFPDRQRPHLEYRSLDHLSERERNKWIRAYMRFLQALQLQNSKRLIIKSPHHTWRVRLLQQLFPEARFIHIVRNPYDVYVSTLHFWKSFSESEGFQAPAHQGLENFVLDTYVDMQKSLESSIQDINDNKFFEIHYEDLVKNPLEELEQLYRHLDLPSFNKAKPFIEEYLNDQKDYKKNNFTLTKDQSNQVTKRWGPYIKKYGYPLRDLEDS